MSESAAHVVPLRTYVLILTILMALTATTIWVAFQDYGPLNNVIALTIAVTKMTLVILFFMHVRYATRLTWLVVVAGVVWLIFLIGILMSDYFSRGWLGVPGK